MGHIDQQWRRFLQKAAHHRGADNAWAPSQSSVISLSFSCVWLFISLISSPFPSNLWMPTWPSNHPSIPPPYRWFPPSVGATDVTVYSVFNELYLTATALVRCRGPPLLPYLLDPCIQLRLSHKPPSRQLRDPPILILSAVSRVSVPHRSPGSAGESPRDPDQGLCRHPFTFNQWMHHRHCRVGHLPNSCHSNINLETSAFLERLVPFFFFCLISLNNWN